MNWYSWKRMSREKKKSIDFFFAFYKLKFHARSINFLISKKLQFYLKKIETLQDLETSFSKHWDEISEISRYVIFTRVVEPYIRHSWSTCCRLSTISVVTRIINLERTIHVFMRWQIKLTKQCNTYNLIDVCTLWHSMRSHYHFQ